MDSFDTSEFTEESRKILGSVLREIKEQFLVNGRREQFWFDASQVMDNDLTEPIIRKWFQVLSNKGVIHFYRPSHSFEFEQSLAMARHYLEKGYEWEEEMLNPVIFGFAPLPYPSIAVDILGNDLDKLIQSVSMDRVCNRFYVDKGGKFYYDNTLLTETNSSSLKRAILHEFLLSDTHMVSAKRIMELLIEDEERVSRKSLSEDDRRIFIEDSDNQNKRNRLMSEIKRELRRISHEVEIKTYKQGHKADYYQMILSP